MTVTLLCLHGFTLNGQVMRAAMRPLAVSLAAHVNLLYPDAPNVCTPGTVDRLYQAWNMPRAEAPHLCWWDARDEGRVYDGWEQTLATLRELIERNAPAAVLGFSQGAMLAATLAALSSRGKLPRLAFAVLVAGTLPRAPLLLDEFDELVNVPSFHVWGERDRLTGPRAPALVARFDPASREEATWDGGHSLPGVGPVTRRLVDFVSRHAAAP